MELNMARFLKNKEQLLHYLAQQNIVPVKAPPWADYPFELRRVEKIKRGQIGRHITGRKTVPMIMEVLGVRNEESCKQIRNRIKQLRKAYSYK